MTVTNILKCTLFLIVCAHSVSHTSARLINITYLDNCHDDHSPGSTVFVRNVDYHYGDDGMCDMVHADLDVQTVDMEPLELVMTLYKCTEIEKIDSCFENPTYHDELLDCERLTNDSSGPWHMITAAMDDGKCGEKVRIGNSNY